MCAFVNPKRLTLAAGAIAAAATSTILLPSVFAAPNKDCHGKVCHPIEEFCSAFIEGCDKCSNICDVKSHNYHADTCASQCAEYKKYDPLQAEIHAIQIQQRIILILLVVLLVLILIRYAYKCFRWIRHMRCFTQMLKKFQPKKPHVAPMGNDKDAMTIQNVMTINEADRSPSRVYSVTGAEGSVMTLTTPVSGGTRWPTENSTTPTTIAAEYSYDNQALVVTPISEKPNATQAF